MLNRFLWVGLAITLTACSPAPDDLVETYMTALQAGENSKAQELSCVPKQFQPVTPNSISDWQILIQKPNRSEGVTYTETIVRVDMPDGIGHATLTWELWVWKPADAYSHYQKTRQDREDADRQEADAAESPVLSKADWSARSHCISHQR